MAASDVNITVLCQYSLDIQLDLKCHLAFSNYPQLELFHKLRTSTTSMINFDKFSPNHQFDPNTEMPQRFSFKQFYLRAKQYGLCSISTKFKRIHPSFLPSFLRISNKVQIRIKLVPQTPTEIKLSPTKYF